MRCRRPRSGILSPSASGTGSGTRPSLSRTQSTLLRRNLSASSIRHPDGTVTTTARRVLLTRSVSRRAPACRRTSTGTPIPCT